MTPSAALADYVFPAAATVERSELWALPPFWVACPKGIGPLHERDEADPALFDVFESNANVLCPNDHEYCSPETGSWPHTALRCRVEPDE